MSRARRILRRVGRIASTAVLVLLALVVAFPAIGRITGAWQLVPVRSGSMEPGFGRGDLELVRSKPRAELRVGDVLLYKTPPEAPGPLAGQRVIHRIHDVLDPRVARIHDPQPGVTYLRTKGDAVEGVDPWIAAVRSDKVWTAHATIPNLGYPMLWSERPVFRWAAVALVGLALGLVGLRLVLDGLRTESVAPAVRRSRRAPAAAAIVVVLGASAVAGASAGARAVFTEREQSPGSDTTGAVSLAFDPAAGAPVRLDVPITGLTPGASAVRIIDLRNTGSIDASAIQLTTTDRTPTALTTDRSLGLQLVVDRCSVAWAGTAAAPTCSGSLTSVVTDTPIVGRFNLLPGSPAGPAGGVDHLRVTVRLPVGVVAGSQGSTSTVRFAFVSVGRAAISR